jgi:WD40 repeat protein
VTEPAKDSKNIDASESQIGVVGDRAEIKGGIHYTIIHNYYRQDAPPLATAKTDIPAIDVPIPENPYRSLFAFGPDDAEFFFGRGTFTQRLVQATESRSLVTVLGASGSGKSSAVFAGLVPALLNQSNERWLFTTFRPQDDPILGLAKALVPLYETELSKTEQILQARKLATGLQDSNLPLTDVVKDIQQSHPAHRLLIIADQFEELYTLCRDPNIRQKFLDLLLGTLDLTNDMALRLVLTLRADFLGQASLYRPFADVLQDTIELLGPMNRGEMTEAVVEPARLKEVTFEAKLVDRLLDDVGEEEGSLPLLEFALTELWQRQQGRTLTHVAYDEIGGVKGALSRHADKVYQRLSAEDQVQARRIFVQLVIPGAGTEDTRRVARQTDLAADWSLVARLASERLVVTNQVQMEPEEQETPATQNTVEVVHEALIQNWRQLRVWMDEDRKFRTWQESLRVDLKRWQETNQDEGALLRGAPLASAAEKRAERPADLSQAEKKYIEASLKRHQQREQWRKFTFSSVVIAAIIMAVLAIVALVEQKRAIVQAKLATSRQLAVQSLTLLDNQIDLSLLLSLEAIRIANTLEAKSSLLAGLTTNSRLMTFLHGHTTSVSSVAFSPDGHTLASSSLDNTVRLWDVATGQPLDEFHIRDGNWVWSVAFSPDGQTLASGSNDGTIYLWDMGTYQLVGELTAHDNAVQSVAFSPDGQTLASGSRDTSIHLWDVATGQSLGEPLTGHNGRVWSVAFSPDGQTLASGDDDGTIQLWDLDTGKSLGEPLTGHDDSVLSVAFSPDGHTLASGSLDNTIILWDMSTGKPLGEPLTGHDDSVLSVAFSPDGHTLASGSLDNTIILWDMHIGQHLLNQRLIGHKQWVSSVAFNPDGQILASGGGDNTIRLWDVAAGQTLGRFLTGHDDEVSGVAFSPDGQTLASASEDSDIILWDVVTGRPLGEPLTGHDDGVVITVFSPDGQTLASASRDRTIRLWDVTTHQPLGEPLIGHTDQVQSVAFSPDGQTLASGSDDNTVILWDVATHQPLGKPLTGHKKQVTSVVFSPDGEILASSSLDTTIRLWDVATHQPLGEPLTGHDGWVWSIAFSPDGQTLASGSQDTTIRLWNVTTHQPLGEPLAGHDGWVWSVAFSPDGQTLASGSSDKTIRLWDMTTGQPFSQALTGHADSVQSVAFSPDGQTLASGSRDQNIILWDVNLKSWQTRACRRANRNLTQLEWNRFIGPDVPYQHTCVNTSSDAGVDDTSPDN